MSRIERIRELVDEIVRKQPDALESRCGFVHLYGVSVICALLALKRGLDPELCITAGVLHDIWSYKVGPTNHAELGAQEATLLLRKAGGYSEEEVALITEAIHNHSSKGETHGGISELLKDADVLHHHLYHLSPDPNPSSEERLSRIVEELGVG